ncbi:aa3-type cytochrome oxidase subunit CtaJ [Mycolicibacterium sphagni]|uniref:Uncharacterized protein n=1 Tax=Mycolicibacterium sphagni TaxID=1786 RepID=A0A255D7Z8_9MYCO|nr:hypothetical protein [Mycolicibacterium sphagni]MCV7177031.1 hypothetical protein [Mycolicibacterium sphagni]OYN75529.1 hypothetical protein CG716_25290 [Mycolicibacterium sphagni]
MNVAVVHLLFVGIPFGLAALLALLIFPGRGKHPATYKLSEPWTHAPILWAAVDEVVPSGGHHGHGEAEVNVGGQASGKW